MRVYYIYKEGVYGHGVHGIFLDETKAAEATKECARKDVDAYHRWSLYECDTDQISSIEQITGEGISFSPEAETLGRLIISVTKNDTT